MKRILVCLISILALVGMASYAGATPYTSSVFIHGKAYLNLLEPDKPINDVESFATTAIEIPERDTLELSGHLGYKIVHELPPLDKKADWTLEAGFSAKYKYSDDGKLNKEGHFDTGLYTTSLGSFPYAGSFLEEAHDYIVGTILSLPQTVYDYPIGDFLVSYELADDSSLEEGKIKFSVLGPDVFDVAQYTPAEAKFKGFLSVTAEVPEPSTMLLIGTGLIGFLSLSRKKLFKK